MSQNILPLGGFFMRRRRSKQPWGLILVTAGIIVLMSLILPEGFWWFMLGVALITCGVYICRCRR